MAEEGEDEWVDESSPGRDSSFEEEDGVLGVVDFVSEVIEDEGVEPVGVGRDDEDVDVDEIEGCVGEELEWLVSELLCVCVFF